MTHFVQAIYEHGVFRPLEPVKLAEHERVSLVVTGAAATPDNDGISTLDDAALNRQREALAALRVAMEALPPRAPVDGLGGADHDQILYGGKQ